jgi:hypothetical protein
MYPKGEVNNYCIILKIYQMYCPSLKLMKKLKELDTVVDRHVCIPAASILNGPLYITTCNCIHASGCKVLTAGSIRKTILRAGLIMLSAVY